ncbi:DMT family transporter [Natronospirillum operosum]|uniref:DMT family transporter n=1 Tax=Natronospirillum operosum TaxID=2759953 RepID=A0A4Z0WCT4_9GAMM|nr:DMT family transporter [Natronospirillum operosum]TGG92394.1 DMT family transporter [Natronospirillum operosum]
MGWIAFTLMAACMQAIRVAAQKQLSGQMSALGVTFVRYLFGLPFVALYLYWLGVDFALVQQASPVVWAWILAGGIFQIIATWALISVFRWHNFAVGTTLAKTETLLAAVFGALFFGLSLTFMGWTAVLIGMAGIICLSWPARVHIRNWLSPATLLGLLSGLLFAVNALAIHHSSRLFDLPPIHAAAVVLCSMILMQIPLMVLWMTWREPRVWRDIRQHWRPGLFIGLTSAIGSVGWFTAMSLQNPALVKTLGQVEFFLVLLITLRVFRERIQRREWAGMALILLSVIVVMQAG